MTLPRLPAVDTYPGWVSFVQTIPGRAVLFVVFAIFLKVHALQGWIAADGVWIWLAIAALATAEAGPYRRYVLFLCTCVFLVRSIDWIHFDAITTVLRREYLDRSISSRAIAFFAIALYLPLASLFIWVVRIGKAGLILRTPLVWLHLAHCILIGLAAYGPFQGGMAAAVWGLVTISSAYLWYLCYAVIDQKRREPPPFLFQLATFNPFAWPAVVPMGKGAANWRSVEASNPSELAVTQLKAAKLLVWALFLSSLLTAFKWVVFQQLGLPDLKLAFERYLENRPFSSAISLLGIFATFPVRLLEIAIMGHIIIATARYAGFRLLRNTYRPLSSRTIVDFWNRYVYYFKELLAHIYFYPTFVRCFRRHPRLRVAFATFMAAGVGNFFFHFTMQVNTIAKYGLIEALFRMQTYGFYCLLLSGGIIVSQLRTRKRSSDLNWVRRQLIPSLGVAAFFCFLSFFDGPQRHIGLSRHIEFLLHAFGVTFRF